MIREFKRSEHDFNTMNNKIKDLEQLVRPYVEAKQRGFEKSVIASE